MNTELLADCTIPERKLITEAATLLVWLEI